MSKKIVYPPPSAFASAIFKAVDQVMPAITNHHTNTGYITHRLAKTLNWPIETRQKATIAALLHDAGTTLLQEKISSLQFESNYATLHAKLGHHLLKRSPCFQETAEIILHHHTPWKRIATPYEQSAPSIAVLSNTIQLADSIDLITSNRQLTPSQQQETYQQLLKYKGTQFAPVLIDAFKQLSQQADFWHSLASRQTQEDLQLDAYQYAPAQPEQLLDFAQTISKLVDFKNPRMALHSAAVAGASKALAHCLGLSDEAGEQLKIAGYLHDIGKLGIPDEILNKPGPFTQDEFNIMKTHVDHTYAIIREIKPLRTIAQWTWTHHERLNASGYHQIPETSLSIEEKTLAVADVLVAITENRPYRKKFSKEEAIQFLRHEAEKHLLDFDIILTLEKHYDEITLAISKETDIRKDDYKEIEKMIIQHQHPHQQNDTR
jgi:HD-GYP domain-containing protein (c-di-GMP phosphodiesterase class II)